MTRQYRPVFDDGDIALIVAAIDAQTDSDLELAEELASNGEAGPAAYLLAKRRTLVTLRDRLENLQDRPTREVTLAEVPGQTSIEDFEEDDPSVDHEVDDEDESYHEPSGYTND